MTPRPGKPAARRNVTELILIGGWLATAIAFGTWQHSVAAGIFMGGIIVCFRWNR